MPGLGLDEKSITIPPKAKDADGEEIDVSSAATSFVEDPNFDGNSEDNHKYYGKWRKLLEHRVIERP